MLELDAAVDLDYFKQIIERNKAKASYLDQLTERPEASTEQELELALDEIKKNERDLNLLGMAAEELISRYDELNTRATAAELRTEAAENTSKSVEAECNQLKADYDDAMKRQRSLEFIKDDLERKTERFEESNRMHERTGDEQWQLISTL